MALDPGRLAADLDTAAEEVGDLTGVHTTMARVVLTAAQPKTPRRTGRLAASLRSDVDSTGFAIVSDTRYAPYVHARRPWIAQAITATTNDQVDLLADHLTAAVKKIG